MRLVNWSYFNDIVLKLEQIGDLSWEVDRLSRKSLSHIPSTRWPSRE